MTVREIFLTKLRNGNYQNDAFWKEEDWDKKIEIAEADRENVFHAIYGDGVITNRGTRPVKEWMYRYGEALEDLKQNLIKMTMHYIIMQIHINVIKL